MSKYQVVSVRSETEDEKARKAWLFQQRLDSPHSLEEAARLLIGLVTGLLTVLFGVLSLNSEAGKLPIYLSHAWLRWVASGAVLSFLLALVTAISVVFPRRRQYKTEMPANQLSVFETILREKSIGLSLASGLFATGILLLGIVVIFAILLMS